MENLKMETRGEEVKKLQTMLKEFGFYMGSVDGVFGSQTETAVKRFQKQTGLTVDGIVGAKTWMMLNNAYITADLPDERTSDLQSFANGVTKYEVKSGDSLWSLAQKFDTTLDCIMSENKLTSMNLAMGQELTIPVGKRACAIAMNNERTNTNSYEENPIVEMQPESNTQKYSVVYGDSLWKIAQRFGTTIDEIKKMNGLSKDSLSIGQVLTISN